MTITLLTSELQAEFLKNYTNSAIVSVVSEESDEGGFYNTTITFAKYYDADLIAQALFGAGISYGLDLKYSHYGTQPERVR